MPASRAKEVSKETQTWVNQTLQGMISEGANRREMILGLRRQRFLRLKPRVPEAYARYVAEGVRVPITFRLGETVVGAVAGTDKARFFASSPDVELAQRATAWAQLQLDVQERVSQSALYYRYWDSLINDGMAALKTQRSPWTDFPDKGEEEDDEAYNARVEAFLDAGPPVPYRTRTVDPATFYPPRSEWGRVYAAESALRPTAETMRCLGLQVGPRGKLSIVDPNDEPTPTDMYGLRLGPRIQVDELWTETDLFVRVSGKVFQYDNEMGRLPFEWTSGSAIAFSDPTLQALSVHYPLQYLEPWVNQMLSTLVAQAGHTSTPTPITTHPATGTPAGAGGTVVTDFQAGKLHDLPPGADFKWEAAPLDAGAINLFNAMVQLAERFTLSPIPQFAGTRTPGVVLSAVAERIMSVLKPKVDMAKTTWSDQIKFYLHVMRHVVGAPISVSGLVFEERTGRSSMATTTLRPSEVPRISDIATEIKFQTVQDKIAWNTQAVLMVQSGMWSLQRGMREAGVSDTERERQDIMLDRLRQSPAIQLYLQQRAMEGQPPLQALQELAQAGGQQAGIEPAAGGLGMLGSGGANPALPQGGRAPGEARAPGGERPQGASRFLGE